MTTDVAEIAGRLSEAEQLQCQHGRGHVTRYSDSSLYDEKCIFCGAVDGMPTLGFPNTLEAMDCKTGLAVRAYLENSRATD